MLELNTDRMLFGIGALLLGAAMLFGVMDYLPGALSMWSYGTSESINGVDVAYGQVVDVTNPDFSEGNRGWVGSESVTYDGQTAYVPGGSQIYTTLGVPENSQVQVSFRASGSGSVEVGFGGSSGDNSREMYLFNTMGTQNVTITRREGDGTRLGFVVAPGSTMTLDSIEVTFMGVVE